VYLPRATIRSGGRRGGRGTTRCDGNCVQTLYRPERFNVNPGTIKRREFKNSRARDSCSPLTNPLAIQKPRDYAMNGEREKLRD